MLATIPAHRLVALALLLAALCAVAAALSAGRARRREALAAVGLFVVLQTASQIVSGAYDANDLTAAGLVYLSGHAFLVTASFGCVGVAITYGWRHRMPVVAALGIAVVLHGLAPTAAAAQRRAAAGPVRDRLIAAIGLGVMTEQELYARSGTYIDSSGDPREFRWLDRTLNSSRLNFGRTGFAPKGRWIVLSFQLIGSSDGPRGTVDVRLERGEVASARCRAFSHELSSSQFRCVDGALVASALAPLLP